MDLFIKVTGYNSKFFFYLKLVSKSKPTHIHNPLNELFENPLQLQSHHSSSIRFSFDIFEIKLPNE